MHEYSQADLTRLFHLSKTLLRSLVQAGYIPRPARTGKTRYSFQDLLILRTASALQALSAAAPTPAGAADLHTLASLITRRES